MNPSFSQDIAAIANIAVVPKILDVICATTGLGVAAVARVTADRWVVCAAKDDISFGLKPGGELKVEPAPRRKIQDSDAGPAGGADPIFGDGLTPEQYGFQSYISTPIFRGGAFFGTLCAIDPRPAELKSPDVLTTFELFAALIGSHLDAHDRLARSEAALSRERDTADVREQFIAVLGHDLRNPLAAIEGGTSLLRRNLSPDKVTAVVTEMRRSAARMREMIDNVLDFARGRLGGGIDVARSTGVNVGPALEHVIAEFRTAKPGCRIETDFKIADPVPCDARRLAQLASKLVANALAHGAADQPVRVAAFTKDSAFELSVSNAGKPIDPAMIERLFHPFTRASARPGQGLGLGLYIASEIARAHNGALTVTSDETETRFTFRMPL